jgi:hypothetical protein
MRTQDFPYDTVVKCRRGIKFAWELTTPELTAIAADPNSRQDWRETAISIIERRYRIDHRTGMARILEGCQPVPLEPWDRDETEEICTVHAMYCHFAHEYVAFWNDDQWLLTWWIDGMAVKGEPWLPGKRCQCRSISKATLLAVTEAARQQGSLLRRARKVIMDSFTPVFVGMDKSERMKPWENTTLEERKAFRTVYGDDRVQGRR